MVGVTRFPEFARMQGYDFVMVAVLVGAVAWGAWKGFAWQVASMASMVLSYFVALNFRAPVAQAIKATPPWNVFVAMLVLFLGTSLVVWLCFNFVSQAIERMKLKEFDRQVGAIIGFAKGVLLCIIITLFAMTLLDQTQRQQIVNSRSGMYIAHLLAKADAVMPQEIRQVLAPYVDGLENPNRNSEFNYGALEPARDLLNQAAQQATQQFEKTLEAQPARGSYYSPPQNSQGFGQGGYGQPSYGGSNYGTSGQPSQFGTQPQYNGQPVYNDPQMADRFRQQLPPVQPPVDRPY
jgi:membrane protein required for colicin V production